MYIIIQLMKTVKQLVKPAQIKVMKRNVKFLLE